MIMTKRFLKLVLSSLLAFALVFSYNALAATNSAKLKRPPRKWPHGCREIGYDFQSNLLVLNPVSDTEKIQTVYLIHNKSPQDIHFMAERDPKDITALDYENVIKGEQWAAFALNLPTVSFRCVVDNETNEQVDCAQTLELCQFNRAKFGTALYGTYWMIQSFAEKDTTYRELMRMGVLLRW